MQTATMKLRELSIRYAVRKSSDGQPVVIGRTLATPKDAAAAFVTLLQDEPSEVFGILCLNTKHRVIAWHEVRRRKEINIATVNKSCYAARTWAAWPN